MIEVIVFWLMCGVVTAIIAGAKNRNPIGWFLIGSLISIFGIILVCALPDPTKKA
jgi:hypothetical protein